MRPEDIHFEFLTAQNIMESRGIQRDDVSTEFVDDADTLLELTEYGEAHGCIGHTYLIKYHSDCIGILLLGEALPWETDPEEMRRQPFYRLMGFVIDKRYRGRGIGGYALEAAIADCYREFGARPIALGCHKDNWKAAEFYQRHGFQKTDAMEGNDHYYLRYTAQNKANGR